jgi:hypothetical protein
MSRRRKVTIIVLIIVLLIFGLFIFLEFGEQATGPSQQPEDEGPIFPFATTSDFFVSDDDDGIDIDDQPTEPKQQPGLWKISDDPVAGSRWVSTGDTDQDRLWFIKKANGFLFSANPQTRDVTQLTDTRIPQVREVIIGPAGQTAIYRYLDDEETIQTYKATFSKLSNGESSYSVSGSFLPTDIYEISMSPDGSRIFYLQETNNRSIGVLYNTATDSQQQVFNSEVSDWRASFNQPNHVTLFTPPADGITGYGYELNLNTGQKTKINEGEALVLSANMNGSNHLITTRNNGTYQTKPSTDTRDGIAVSTFTDKCNWVNNNVFFCGVPNNSTPSSLNAWYQGRLQFTDNLNVFNAEENNQNELFSSDQIEKANADIIDIMVNDNFGHAAFTDKKTGDLWGYKL